MRKRKLQVMGWIIIITFALVACTESETLTPTSTLPLTSTTIVVKPFSGTYIINVDIANLRTGPSIEHDLLNQVSKGNVFEITGISEDGEWVRTTTNGWLPLIFLKENSIENFPTPSHTPSETELSTQPSLTVTSQVTLSLTNTSTSTTIPPIVCVRNTAWVIYLVQPNDTLIDIANQTGTTVDALMQANCLKNQSLLIDQRLFVPTLPITPSTVTVTLQIEPTSTPANDTIEGPIVIDLPTSTSTSLPAPTNPPPIYTPESP